jgi:DNA adenine methylase
MFNSPLRYPGGKNKLAAFFAKICLDNGINGHYVEPYSGGASVALFLLLEGFVDKITINDMDRSIYSFWFSVLNHTDRLCEMILNTEITVENWNLQKLVQDQKETVDLLSLGFSTLFLNRTNRSGIIKGGIIGGQGQSGDYKIDCRFNKNEIISRIKRIARHKDKIRLLNIDAIELINLIESEGDRDNTLCYFDPPYYNKASSLYMNHYQIDDHFEVSESIKRIQTVRWVVSYDDVPEIQKLYSTCQKKEYTFSHTAGKKKKGLELLFFSDNLTQPNLIEWNPIYFRMRRLSSHATKIHYQIRKKKALDNQLEIHI